MTRLEKGLKTRFLQINILHIGRKIILDARCSSEPSKNLVFQWSQL